MERAASEREPLLGSRTQEDLRIVESTEETGEGFDDVPKVKRQLGLMSTYFLILNRMVGAGIFAVPSVILRASGSVGTSLFMWLFGSTVAAAGTLVFVELGAALPRSGGEKIYLEFIYRRPRFLATCIFAVYGLFIGWSAANSVAFGEYFLHAFNIPATRFSVRLTAFCCLTFCCTLHATKLMWGVHLQNALGIIKISVLAFMTLSGVLLLIGFPGIKLRDGVDPPHNFELEHFWEGSQLAVSPLFMGLTNVMWCYMGYQSTSFFISEVRDPIRTLRRATLLAVSSLTVLYLIINLSYLAAISKNDILNGGRIVGALFFRNLYGPETERFVSFVIACSTLGNCLSTIFAHGRVVQELGREGVIPFSSYFASNRPFGAPFASLFQQWVVVSVIVLGPPPGDAYVFLQNWSSYPTAVFNTFLGGGLLALHLGVGSASKEWRSPYRAPTFVVGFYFLANVFLMLAPLVRPPPWYKIYEHLPYWVHAVASLSTASFGIMYWYVWFRWLPRRGGYVWERHHVLQEDGVSREVFRKVSETAE